MNDLEKYFYSNKGRGMHKWTKYFEVYDTHFSRFRNKKVSILEIGVQNGGSLQMWKAYFGNDAKIYGIDTDPNCSKVEEDRIKVFIGHQNDLEFLSKTIKEIGGIDIIIDDGSHYSVHQIGTFNKLYSCLNPGGLYLVEDCHTSYWSNYVNTDFGQESFIAFSKRCIDSLNAYHLETKLYDVNEITICTKSINFYPSIVVFEKSEMPLLPDKAIVTGEIFDVAQMKK